MKNEWIIYLIGLAIVSVALINNSSDKIFFAGLLLMIIGFVIQTVNKRKSKKTR